VPDGYPIVEPPASRAKLFNVVTTPPDTPDVAASTSHWRKVWRIARYVIGLALLGAAAWAVSGKTDELQGATTYLAHLRVGWLLVALGAEGASYLAYASLQRRLLFAGRVKIPMAPMFGIGLSGQAMQNSLPGGTLFNFVYVFRQYRRFGADDLLAGWVLVAFNLVSFVTLAGIAAVGLLLALSAGNTFDLVESILGVVIIAALLVIAWAERARLLPHLTRALKFSQWLFRWPKRGANVEEVIGGWLNHLSAISPTGREWRRAFLMGGCNWLGDLSCLALSFMAVGASVPWRGLLLAYGAGQLAAMLPVTPGGLGVVEGSLTVALVTFGGGKTSTVAAVLLYRLISFWLVIVTGWTIWSVLTWRWRNRPAVLEPSPA
jgi:uncharacterized membrane protein YbhN (UPF0104 family)